MLEGCDQAKRLFRALREAVERIGDVEYLLTKSQIAFRRRRAFARVWRPEARLRRAGLPPLVLSISLRRAGNSPRWKEVVEPAPGRYLHHLALREPAEIDEQVQGWLREAWDGAG